jgi:hypothetical protein
MDLVRYGEPAGRWVLLATVLGSSLAFVDATVVAPDPRVVEPRQADVVRTPVRTYCDVSGPPCSRRLSSAR